MCASHCPGCCIKCVKINQLEALPQAAPSPVAFFVRPVGTGARGIAPSIDGAVTAQIIACQRINRQHIQHTCRQCSIGDAIPNSHIGCTCSSFITPIESILKFALIATKCGQLAMKLNKAQAQIVLLLLLPPFAGDLLTWHKAVCTFQERWCGSEKVKSPHAVTHRVTWRWCHKKALNAIFRSHRRKATSVLREPRGVATITGLTTAWWLLVGTWRPRLGRWVIYGRRDTLKWLVWLAQIGMAHCHTTLSRYRIMYIVQWKSGHLNYYVTEVDGPNDAGSNLHGKLI